LASYRLIQPKTKANWDFKLRADDAEL